MMAEHLRSALRVNDQFGRVVNSLGMGTVAEGIETEVKAAMAREPGCDRGQGYFFSKLRAALDVASWLASAPPRAERSEPPEHVIRRQGPAHIPMSVERRDNAAGSRCGRLTARNQRPGGARRFTARAR